MHVIHFLKSRNYFLLNLGYVLIYTLLEKKIIFFLNNVLAYNKIYKKKYRNAIFFNIEMKSFDLVFFNQGLLNLMNRFKEVNLKLSLASSNIKKYKNIKTLLRSPFVYSKSREQFMFEINKCNIFIKNTFTNIFVVEYIEGIVSDLFKGILFVSIKVKKKLVN